jgi:hypothetical protein
MYEARGLITFAEMAKKWSTFDMANGDSFSRLFESLKAVTVFLTGHGFTRMNTDFSLYLCAPL